MSRPIALQHWPARLEAVVRDCALFNRVTVLRETGSTQDAARRLRAQPGDVVTAWRQTAGRGRLGRKWADTGKDGLAVTFVVDRGQPEALAIAAAIGAARALESLLSQPAGIKWPNDIIVDDRKLAGILIEQFDSIALVGIGVNVSQTIWPADLSRRAVSLAQLGVRTDRLDVLAALLPAIDKALQLDLDQLQNEFAARDVLRGRPAAFRAAGRTITGVVRCIDPMRGLTVETAGGCVVLPPQTTTLASNPINCPAAMAEDYQA